jgi:ABC-2 type transport system ATP-binding protein
MKGRLNNRMKMIEIEGLTRRFGNFTAVDNISLQVEKGEVLGFLGPNGAGKSTTIRMLCTLLRPTEGTARVAGFDIGRQPGQVRQHIGLVAEKLILYDQLTAEENLRLFGRMNNMPADQIRDGIDTWLGRLAMKKWQKHLVGTFSTGMKQRINVARALLHHPDVLFLDEPTLGLDPQTTRAIHEFALELRTKGITIVLTTHDMVEAETMCDRIAIIDQAKIVALDSTQNLKRLLGGGDTTIVDMEISNLSDSIVTKIGSLETVTSVTQADAYRVRIHTRGDNALGPVISAISSGGASLRSIKTVEPSLEDVFLHLTGREIRDKVADRVPSMRARRWGGRSRVR